MKASRRAPSTVVLLFFHQEENLALKSPRIFFFALKSPRILVARELDDTVVFKMSSKFDKTSSH